MTKSLLHIISLPSVESAIQTAAESMLAEIKKSVLADKKVLLLLAGGSATKVYAQAAKILALQDAPADYFKEKLSIAVEDERWPEKNNTSDAMASGFIQACQKLGASFIQVPDAENMHTAAEKYDALLAPFFDDATVNKILMIGMGGDGHILGVNADADADRFAELFEGQRRFVAYESQAKTAQFPNFPRRITLTLTGLKEIDSILGLVAGAEKVPVLRQLQQGDQLASHLVPAVVLREKNTSLFTDQNL